MLPYLNVEVAPSDKLMGCNPRGSDRLGASFPIFEDVFKETPNMIPENQWDKFYGKHKGQEQFCKKTKDQDGEGACTSNAFTAMFETLWNIEFGTAYWIEISAMSLYKRCAGGPNTGSTLPDNARQLQEYGALPTDSALNLENPNIQHTHPEIGFRKSLPTNWKETAKDFRVTQWFDVASFEGMVSALLSGFCVVYGRAGHCILAVKLVKEGGQWHIRYKNSWGQWGDNGCGHDSRSFVSRGINQYGCFAGRDVCMPAWMWDNLPVLTL